MSDTAGLISANDRLDAALARLDAAIAALGSAANGDALNAVKAERDLLLMKHRRLVQNSEAVLTGLDALIRSGER